MNTTEIIGTPIKIGNLEVSQYDFPEEMDWDTSIQACLGLGDGWRLPIDKELDIFYQSKENIGRLNAYYYWSSAEYNNDGTYDYEALDEKDSFGEGR